MADFPASLPNIPDAGTTLGTTGGASAHATIHGRIEEELLAIATRLGVVSESAMTLAPGVTAHASGWLSPASSHSAGFTVTRGMLVNSSGASQPGGTVIAQITAAAHWPAGTVSFTSSSASGAAVMRVDINSVGQIVISQSWANAAILNVGGFVWWV